MPEFDPRQVDASLPLYDPPTSQVPKHKLEVRENIVCTWYKKTFEIEVP